MATGTEDGRSKPRPILQASHRGAPTPIAVSAVSPPSKSDLTSWWKKFSRKSQHDEEKGVQPPGIFGVPLSESIRYANVAISLSNERGESFIYGYVPIVVAKCGVFLKERATDVEGIFRLSGSAKRINQLQALFNSPDRYGKGLDWTGYTVHDAANILRRYLNQLPEPIVPLDCYERFRDPLRAYSARNNHRGEEQIPDITVQEHGAAVVAYQRLITELPALNRQLLLYILDLLAVFASKSDLNRMTAANLAAIFQPGILLHPTHDQIPQEYRLSQDVLIFLIENQDNFLIGMNGTAVDEQTQKDVESGAPSAKSPQPNIGRSASNASAGADSLRNLKYGIRRNVSAASRTSKDRTSPNVSSPATPSTPSYGPPTNTGGLGRSNTVPSKRSPAIGQRRFSRNADSTSQNSTAAVTPTAEVPAPIESSIGARASGNVTATDRNVPDAATVTLQDVPPVENPVTPIAGEPGPVLATTAPSSGKKSTSRERTIQNFLKKSPLFGPSPTQVNQGERQPRKLQKRQRLPGSMNESATSSAASLHNDDGYHTPLVSPSAAAANQADPMAAIIPAGAHTPAHHNHADKHLTTPPPAHDRQGSALRPAKSPSTSLHSGTSVTDPSDFDALDDFYMKGDAEKRRHRWRISSSTKQNDDSPLAPPPLIGQMTGARTSNSSLGSSTRPSQSFTQVDSQISQHAATDTSSMGPVVGHASHESHDTQREQNEQSEKRGLFGKLRARIQQSKEEKREREAEKERAKSPQRLTGDNSSSRNSLSAFAHEHLSPRAKSFDKGREDVLSPVNEQPRVEQQAAQTNVIPPTPIEPIPHVAPSSDAPEPAHAAPAEAQPSAPSQVVEAPATETRTEPLIVDTIKTDATIDQPPTEKSQNGTGISDPATK